MRISFWTVVLSFFILSMTAFQPATSQAGGCYTPDQAAAEQAIRFHSELLVIGLNCEDVKSAGRPDSYRQYRRFTSNNADLLRQFEGELLGFFKQRGHENPAAALNTLRTDMANNLAELAARMRPDVFCYRYSDRLDEANAMEPRDLKKWAATHFPSAPTSRQYCLDTSHY